MRTDLRLAKVGPLQYGSIKIKLFKLKGKME